MSDTQTDDVLYLTALLPEEESMVVPRLSGLIPDCGACIRSVVAQTPGGGRSKPGCRHPIHLLARDHQSAIADLDGQERGDGSSAWRQPLLCSLIFIFIQRRPARNASATPHAA